MSPQPASRQRLKSRNTPAALTAHLTELLQEIIALPEAKRCFTPSVVLEYSGGTGRALRGRSREGQFSSDAGDWAKAGLAALKAGSLVMAIDFLKTASYWVGIAEGYRRVHREKKLMPSSRLEAAQKAVDVSINPNNGNARDRTRAVDNGLLPRRKPGRPKKLDKKT